MTCLSSHFGTALDISYRFNKSVGLVSDILNIILLFGFSDDYTKVD